MNFKINYCVLIIQIILKLKKAIISDSLSAAAPPIGESYNFNAMVIYLTIRKTSV
jgi:hypothetical protein